MVGHSSSLPGIGFRHTGFLPIAAFCLFALLPLPALAQPAHACAQLTGCERKSCEIKVQRTQAEHHGNQARVRGLTKALSEVESHCTNATLKKRRQDDIKDLKHDIAKDEQDLIEAHSEGKADKVRKYQDRLQDKRSRLKRLEQQADR